MASRQQTCDLNRVCLTSELQLLSITSFCLTNNPATIPTYWSFTLCESYVCMLQVLFHFSCGKMETTRSDRTGGSRIEGRSVWFLRSCSSLLLLHWQVELWSPYIVNFHILGSRGQDYNNGTISKYFPGWLVNGHYPKDLPILLPHGSGPTQWLQASPESSIWRVNMGLSKRPPHPVPARYQVSVLIVQVLHTCNITPSWNYNVTFLEGGRISAQRLMSSSPSKGIQKGAKTRKDLGWHSQAQASFEPASKGRYTP